MDVVSSGFVTSRRAAPVQRVAWLLTTSSASADRNAQASKAQNPVDRAEGKIKGGDSPVATFLGLHIGWRGTRREASRAAESDERRSRQQFLRAVFAGLRLTVVAHVDE